jgi:hypothetical protein
MNQKLSSGSNTDNTFWSRQTKRDKIAIAAFVVDIIITVTMILIAVLVPDTTLSIGGRIALLTGNIIVLVAALQFSISRFFDDQEDKLEKIREDVRGVNARINSTLDEMQSMNALGETYIKIFRQDDNMKSLYQNSLDTFMQHLRNWIDDKRSGALDATTYYEVLTELANDLSCDKDKHPESGSCEIWALTFCLDNEWDDSDSFERMWFAKLKTLDEKNIPTKRLWAFDNKMLDLLRKDELDEDGLELLNRLKMYCATDTDYPNTSSFAILKSLISDTHFSQFGKGFFAGKFANNDLSLIRGVCFDNLLSSNSLGGEIDFDSNRISVIRHNWETYLSLAEPLNSFLFSNANTAAKEKMRELGYRENQQ